MHVLYRQHNSFASKEKAPGIYKRMFLQHTEEGEGGVKKGCFLKVQQPKMAQDFTASVLMLCPYLNVSLEA